MRNRQVGLSSPEYGVGEQFIMCTCILSHTYLDEALMTNQTDACSRPLEYKNWQPYTNTHSSCTPEVQPIRPETVPLYMSPHPLPGITSVHIDPMTNTAHLQSVWFHSSTVCGTHNGTPLHQGVVVANSQNSYAQDHTIDMLSSMETAQQIRWTLTTHTQCHLQGLAVNEARCRCNTRLCSLDWLVIVYDLDRKHTDHRWATVNAWNVDD